MTSRNLGLSGAKHEVQARQGRHTPTHKRQAASTENIVTRKVAISSPVASNKYITSDRLNLLCLVKTSALYRCIKGRDNPVPTPARNSDNLNIQEEEENMANKVQARYSRQEMDNDFILLQYRKIGRRSVLERPPRSSM